MLVAVEASRQHCCSDMTAQIVRTCSEHLDRFACPDCLVDYWPESQVFGLIVHDGGRSVIEINYCPWCGALLG